MLMFLLGVTAGMVICLILVKIALAVDKRRDERTLKRARELDAVRDDYLLRLRNLTVALDDSFSYHIDRFHKKGKK